MGSTGPISIGAIDYANAWPLFHGFEDRMSSKSVELISHVPSQLNHLLQEGKLDVSAISSFAYGQHAEQYYLLPQLSIGSIGKVHSILLFLKKPLEQHLPQRIAVSTTSATSVNLLKIVMNKMLNCSPIYTYQEPNLMDMLADADAALLIGDPAIKASWLAHNLHVLDLGELWYKWTGLGMTYAVVAVNRASYHADPEKMQEVYEALRDTLRYNLQHKHKLTDRASEQLGGNRMFWDQYFESLQYDFSEKLSEGLKLYYNYARQIGLLDKEVELKFHEEQSPKKVNE